MQIYSQNDPKWKKKKLGFSGLTLGEAGCVVTSLCMVATHYGKDMNPDRLNEELKQKGGFEGGLYKWRTLTKIYPDISYTKFVNTPNPLTDSQFEEIANHLKGGNVIIIEVDAIPSTAAVDNHYVVLTKKEGSGYDIADPWNGKIERLSKYGVARVTIQRYILYNGPKSNPMDIDAEIFKQCFITLAWRWPKEEEVKQWRESKQAAYTWVQKHAPNPALEDLKKTEKSLRTELKDLREEMGGKVEEALKTAKKTWRVEELEGIERECMKTKNSSSYRIAALIGKLIESFNLKSKIGGGK